MTSSLRLSGVLDWLRAGYPAGVPPTDYIPLLALLRRRLTEDEVVEIADEIARQQPVGQENGAGIAVSITKITDALPTPEDVARVEQRLTKDHGWPESLDTA